MLGALILIFSCRKFFFKKNIAKMSGKSREAASIDRDSHDLSKNPFAALFPSLQHAEEYIRSTKAAAEPEDYRKKSNSSSIAENSSDKGTEHGQEGSSEWHNKVQIINDFLQRGFLFTVSQGSINPN